MKKLVTILLMGFFVIGVMSTTYAADNTKDAINLVDQAVAFMKANGKEKTIAEISKANGKFDKGNLYVFAYDMNATVIAHPKSPALIGKNVLNVADNDGKYFRKSLIQIAKTKGNGWVDYKYMNPETKKVEDKSTYFQKVDDIIICAGVYK